MIVFAHVLDHFLWNDATARYRFDLGYLLRTGNLAGGKAGVELSDSAGAPCRGTPLSERTKNLTFIGLGTLLVAVFWWFRAVSFGMSGDIANWPGLQWRKHWNIY